MAHLVETMAYAGATPWHGLGNNLPQKQPIEVWQREAGMDWSIAHSDVLFNVADDGMLMCGYCPAQIPGTVRSCVSGSLIQG